MDNSGLWRTLAIAIELAVRMHHGQVDKQGKPYIFHLLAVMNKVSTVEEKIVAILHDILEDTPTLSSDLLRHGIQDYLVGAVELLTHTDELTYQAYIERLKDNSLARRVKIADLEHNMDITRGELTPEIESLMRRNHKYWLYLTKIQNGNETEEKLHG